MQALTLWTVHSVFVAVLAFTAFVSFWRGASDEAPRGDDGISTVKKAEFRRFQRLYLACVLVCLGGDWLQGPYMYALYDAYGFSHDEIAALFVAGFGSSCVFGTFVGSLADTVGRKRGALLYVVTYVLSCLTKHWNSYNVLMVGRVLGGISTSLLFSVFDSWVVSEHARRGLDPSLLSTLFANVQAGNSIVAILAGVVGEWSARLAPMRVLATESASSPSSSSSSSSEEDGAAASLLRKNDGSVVVGGFCTPFDVAALVLLIGGVMVAASWTENYGGDGFSQEKGNKRSLANERSSVFASLKAGTLTVFRDKKVLLVGSIAAFFEAAMYSFVFEWTPAVKASPEDRPPYGEIFSIMMLACMAGTRVYASFLSAGTSNAKVTTVFAAAAAALAVPSALSSPFLCLLAFLVFEVAVGIYFPAVGVLKSKLIPDTHRSTIYNLFRVPLNVLVLAVLLSHAPGKVIFAAAATLLALAAVLHFDLHRRLTAKAPDDLPDDDQESPLLNNVGLDLDSPDAQATVNPSGIVSV